MWFLYQLIEANFGLFNAHANAGVVAFFAHVGGFIFGPADGMAPRPGQTGRAPGTMALHDVAPATEVRTGLVSGTVNTGINHQY